MKNALQINSYIATVLYGTVLVATGLPDVLISKGHFSFRFTKSIFNFDENYNETKN